MSAPKNSFPDLTSATGAAKELLGCLLVHESQEGTVSGYIVETEAYDMTDPASHAYGGERVRNRSMFKRAGTVYVYFTYGMHYCLNIVTGQAGRGEGVLLRALHPIDGIDLMRQRRNQQDIHKLANGPAKLVQAMGITKNFDGVAINSGPLKLKPGFKPQKIAAASRIGITKSVDKQLRFYVVDDAFVSRR